MKKKKKDEIEINVPPDYSGEVSVTRMTGKVSSCSITPLTQEFGNGDLNALRDKLNEILTYLNG